MALLLLALSLAALFQATRRQAGTIARFAALPTAAARRRRYLRWTVRAMPVFLLLPLAALALLGRLDALLRLPAEFAPVALAGLDLTGGDTLRFGAMMLAATFAGGGLAGLIAARRRKLGPTAGKIAAMLPRDAGEAAAAALGSGHAAIAEELFFRLHLPLLLCLVGVPAGIAFAVALLLFALAHRYQGGAGVVAAALLGLVLTIVYLATASLGLAMLLHLAINWNAVLLRPLILARLGRRGD